MTPLFTSERLSFREFTLEDGALIYELNSDPEVVKYLHEPATTLESARDIIANNILPQYRNYNHGRWALYLRDINEFIGWCGLKYRPERQVVDLGYRLMKKYWGQGYATEAAVRCIDYGFNVLKLSSLFAAAHLDNIASKKVLEKVGFRFIGIETIDNCLAKTYEMTLENHKVSRE